MNRLLSSVVAALIAVSALGDTPPAETDSPAATPSKAHPVLDSTLTSLSGEPVDMSRHRGKVLLVVNVASECGLTPQYEGLQALHEKYAPQGLALLGFPSNDFGGQEPGSSAQIATFCKKNYGVTFDLFEKTKVLGEDKSATYRWLTTANPAFPGEVTWNFEKFLVGRDGSVVGRFGPKTTPDDPGLVKAIEAALAAK